MDGRPLLAVWRGPDHFVSHRIPVATSDTKATCSNADSGLLGALRGPLGLDAAVVYPSDSPMPHLRKAPAHKR